MAAARVPTQAIAIVHQKIPFTVGINNGARVKHGFLILLAGLANAVKFDLSFLHAKTRQSS
jgi:hypothetical protein